LSTTLISSNKLLVKIIIRLHKNNSAFVYFTLEANEGISFYSTLDSSPDDQFREIEMFCDQSLEAELLHILDKLKEKFPIEILEHSTISDNFTHANNL